MSDYEYQVGGSLKIDSPSYVVRQADSELYHSLIVGDFCYVLSSRQMGKSSVRVRMKYLLEQDGFSCTAIDLTRIGSENITPDQWYKGVISELIRGFGLTKQINLKTWWSERQEISAIQRLSDFIEEVLLVNLASEKIFVFFDEIDSVLSLNFPVDDFFALIRFCYNQRAENPIYNRLTFALFGVASPSDLIADKNRTPFNIGKAIDLKGFQIQEAEPLVQGLTGKIDDPKKAIATILRWTDGQPFLTQKLCKLVVEGSLWESYKQPIKTQDIPELIQKYVIENWEANDEPEHLRTIRDRILANEQKASQLLVLYQRVLSKVFIPYDDSPEQIELLLSGLTIRQDRKLRVKNRIYEEIFNETWIKKQLEILRPYAPQLEAWLASKRRDESRLLRGKALQDAQNWVASHSLSDLDYQFLAASQDLEKRQIEITLEAQRKAAKILEDANQTLILAQQKAKRTIRLSQWIATLLLGLAGFLAVQAFSQQQRALMSEIKALSLSSNELFNSDQRFEALLTAMLAANKLKTAFLWGENKQIREQVISTLQPPIHLILERNRLEQHQAQINSVQFSLDGELIATASADKTVKIWRNNGKLLQVLTGHTGPVNSLSFSPNGMKLATASADKTVKLWARNHQGEFRLLTTLVNHENSVNQLSFNFDGTKLATASADKTVKLWKLTKETLILLQTLTGHQAAVNGVSFSFEGQFLATASADRTSKIWQLNGEKANLVQTLIGHQKEVNKISFSPDGELLATASADKTVKLWKRQPNKQFQLLTTLSGHAASVNGVSWSLDGNAIATSSLDKTVKLWQPNGLLLTTLTGHQKEVQETHFSADGTLLASASGDQTVKLWQLQGQPAYILTGHQNAVRRLSFSPDGQHLATASLDHTIKLWRIQGKGGLLLPLQTLKSHQNEVYGVNFSPDGTLLASASADRTVKLWQVNTTGEKLSIAPKPIQTLTEHNREVYSVHFSPNRQWLASASADNTVKLWQISPGTKPVANLFQTLTSPENWVFDIQFSPQLQNQQIAVASADNKVRLWQQDTTGKFTLKTTFTDPTNWVYQVSFSADGATLAAASGDKTVTLWHLSQPPTFQQSIKGHEGEVYGVNFNPNLNPRHGFLLATASEDRTVKLWQKTPNQNSLEIAATLTNGVSKVRDVQFSPNGELLAIGGENGVAIAFQLESINDLDALLNQGCTWLKEYLDTHPEAKQKLSFCH